jgi:hypothetical protein
MSNTIREIPIEESVNNVLVNHKNLQHLRDTLIQDIATLNDDLIKEQAIESSLLLLNIYTAIELFEEKAKKNTPTESPFPRSIRLNTTLTCSEQGTRETEEFLKLKQSADSAKLAYQQKMRQLIVSTIKLDTETKRKELRATYFASLATMIETKVFYTLYMLPSDSIMKTRFNDEKGGAKTASAYLCISIFNNAEITNDTMYPTLENIQKYLSLDRATFKTSLLTKFNKQEAETMIASNIEINDTAKTNLIISLKNIITYSATSMTTNLLEAHKDVIRRNNARAATEATFNNKATEATTIEVSETLAKEGTMPSQRMIDYINKLVDKRQKENDATNSQKAKNSQNGKNKKGNNVPVNVSNSTNNSNNSNTPKNKKKNGKRKSKNGKGSSSNQQKKKKQKPNCVTPTSKSKQKHNKYESDSEDSVTSFSSNSSYSSNSSSSDSSNYPDSDDEYNSDTSSSSSNSDISSSSFDTVDKDLSSIKKTLTYSKSKSKKKKGYSPKSKNKHWHRPNGKYGKNGKNGHNKKESTKESTKENRKKKKSSSSSSSKKKKGNQGGSLKGKRNKGRK